MPDFCGSDYLDLSRAEDLENTRDKILYRFFEMIPGFFSWSTLLLALMLSAFAPFLVALFIITFDLYWMFRVFYLSFHQISSYRKMKKNLSRNWLKDLKKSSNKNWREIYHIVIFPFSNEGKKIMEEALESVLKCHYPKENIILVFAIEDRAGEGIKKTARELERRHAKSFKGFFISFHPQGLPGEKIGKGANVAYAAKQLEEIFLPTMKIEEKNVLVSLFDSDTKPFPDYFSCLTWHYLNTPDPYKKSYQPIPVYNNNIWNANAICRIIATSSTFWQMMQQERPEQLVTFSSHSMPLGVFLEVGYPKNVVSDDSRIFWRSYFFYKGNYKVVPIYYPVSLDVVMADSVFKTMINQYKQQRRWSWGVENMPYVMFNFLRNPMAARIKIQEKIFHIVTMLEGFWSWATCSILIFCLGWLPLLLGGKDFNISLLSYNLPRFTSQIMTFAMIGMVISAIISMLLLPPKPPYYGKIRTASMLLQWLLLPFTLIFFGSLPALESQTRMIIDKPLGFWVTEKIRKERNGNT